jgi:CheY-like chemotaxis protein
MPAKFLADLIGSAAAPRGVVAEMLIGGGVLRVVADDIVGEEEVIIRPLPRPAGAPNAIEGVALLASGLAVAIVSVQRLGMIEGPSVAVEAASGGRARRLRVLLVDDSRVTREMLRRLLEDAGFSVTGVDSAEAALATLEEMEFDCLVTDIEMPVTSGLALTRELRSHPEHAHLPVIVVSTLDSPADRLAGLESGADAYITKQQLDARELVALIRQVGGGR